MGRNIKIFFAKCRLYVVTKWSQVRSFFIRLKIPRWMQSRRALLAGYVAIMVVLAGVWWVNSPYRLRNITQNPPPLHQELPGTDEPVLTELPATDTEVPEPGSDTDPEEDATTEIEIEESVPVVALPATVIINSLSRPVSGPIALKYGFSWSQTYGDFRWHHGLGLGSTQGTPVLAAYAGTVKDIVSGDLELGTKVILDHGSGWQTIYASLNRVNVQKGQKVAEGQQLGQVGPNPPAGAKSDPHLYFALYKDGESQDPTELFR